MNGQRVASIDIGSNAMRLFIAEEREGRLEALESDRASVRLGADVFDKGLLSEQTINSAVEAIKSFKNKIDAAGVNRFRAIGTSAMREAQNGQVFIDLAEKESGVKIEIIDGDEEARLVYLAVSETVTFSSGIDVLVDIGGGSVEITIVKAGAILFSESVKMGTVRLIRLFGSGEISAKEFEHLVHEYSKTIKTKIVEQLGDQKVERCIGTGGNLETFLQLREKFFNRKSTQLELTELEEILERLQELSVQDRIDKLGLRADRADVIVPAAIVMLHVLRASQATTLVVPGVGVKEGVAYELRQEIKENDPHFCSGNLHAGALVVGQRYHFDEAHAECVAKLALLIFDKTKSLHNLAEEGRKLLELAALLHDIGHYISSRGHHKHSFYLIQSASLPALTKSEKLIVACIARYHRKKFPQENHVGFSALNEDEKLMVTRLAAILRLADGLDREHSQLVQSVGVSINLEAEMNAFSDCSKLTGKAGGVVILDIEGQGDLLLDCWSVKLKSDLFEHAFGLRVEISQKPEK